MNLFTRFFFVSCFGALSATVAMAQEGWVNRAPGLVPNGQGYTAPTSTHTRATLSRMTMSVAAPQGIVSADEATPYVRSIAHALGDDPVRIYEWVLNTIDFVPYHGLKRGAHLTALERSGNDFDTAALLVSLLRAAGCDDLGYRFGRVRLATEGVGGLNASTWLGVDKGQVYNILSLAGVGYSLGDLSSDSSAYVDMPYVWVMLRLNGVEYQLAPSFKAYSKPVSYNVSASGYNSDALYNAAVGTAANVGGTPSGSSFLISAAGRDGLRALLDSYTTNMVADVQGDTGSGVSGAELAGVRTFSPQYVTALPTVLPEAFTALSNLEDWTSIPVSYGVRLNLSVGNIDYSCYTADLQGKKLAIWFNQQVAQLWLDDQNIATEVGVDVTKPAAVSFGYEFPRFTTLGHTRSPAPLDRGGSYVISYGFDRSWGRLNERLRRQSNYVADGVGPTSRELRTENLYVMALQYQNQLAEMDAMAAGALNGYVRVSEHLGIAGQVSAPFVDLPYHVVLAWPATALSPDSAANLTQSSLWGSHAFKCVSYYSSLLEHTTVEQTVTGAGVSTVKMIQRASELNVPVYLAKSLADYEVIKPLLSYFPGARVSPSEVRKIDDAMNAGAKVLLCKNNDMAYNSYRGSGYLLDQSNAVTMGIAGGLAGGYGTTVNPLTTTSFYENWGNDAISGTKSAPSHPVLTFADPVDMSNGAFYHGVTDLALGDEAPHGLSLSRHYTSARHNYDPTGLGRGWTHSYNISINERHPNDFNLYRATPAEVAPFMIGIRAIFDTYKEDGMAKDWVVPAIISCWMGDQLINSRAVVSMGEKDIEFTKLPDGSYAPPAGIAATLVKGSSTYSLKFRKGLEFTFRTSDGRFTTITDRNNSAGTAYNLTAVYASTGGRLTKITDSYGRYLTFTYDTVNMLSGVTDSTGRTVTYGHGAANDRTLLTVTDPEGEIFTYYGDKQYRVNQLIDRKGQTVVTSTYDEWDRVIEQFTFGQENQHWVFGFSEGMARSVDPAGGIQWHYYDTRGRRYLAVDELGHASRWAYDNQDRVVRTVSPAGETTGYTYNRNHEVTGITNNANNTRVITPASDDSISVPLTEKNFEGKATVTTFYPYHKVKDVTSPGGVKTAYEYDTRGRISAVYPAVFAPGEKISYAYTLAGGVISRLVATYPADAANGILATTEITNFSPLGDVIQFIDRRGVKTTTTYDNNRKPLQVAIWSGTYTAASPVGGTPPAGSLITSFTYDANGDVLTKTDNGRTTTYDYDALGKVLAIWGPDGVLVQDNYYDSRNLLSSSFDALGFETSHEYDAAQRSVRVYDALVRATDQSYDAAGRPLTSTTPRGYTTTNDYDATGNLEFTTDAKGQVIGYDYDKDGRLKALTNRRSQIYTTTYDDANRRVTTQTPLLRTRIQDQNLQGLSTRLTEPSNQFSENTGFDPEGRVLTQVHKDGAGTLVSTLTFAYYPGGLLKTVTETPVTGVVTKITRDYDTFGRLSTYTYREGSTDLYTLIYQYDGVGRLWKLLYPDSKTVTYTYDLYDRLKTVTDWANRTTTYTYDLNGRLTRIDRPNGTWRSMAYDADGQLRLAEEHQPGANGALIWLQNLRYDKVGGDFNFHENDGEITWSFTAPTPQAFAQPADTATYDADNQVLTWTAGDTGVTQSPTYDADGNMTAGPDATGASSTYAYDTRNRLIAHGGLTYRYDAEGHRVQAGATTYVVDPTGLGRVLVSNQGGTLTRYVWGLGLIAEETGSATKTYHPNHQGSTVALTDDSGTVTDQIEYAPFGAVTRRIGSSPTPFLLHGGLGVMTDANGLIYMRARYYNPRLMRFLNADPIGFKGGSNWYAYANGNPLSFIDPSGYCGQNSSNSYTSVAGSGMGASWSLQDQAFSNSMGYAPENLNGAYYGQLSRLAAAAGDRALERSANLGLLGAVNDDPSTLARNLVVGLGSGMAPALERSLIQTAERTVGETYFRTMSQAHYEQLLATGKLPATAETFISPSLTYASQYDGVTVQFTLRTGTTNSLMNIGVRNAGLGGETFESLPLVQKGWTSSNAFFKLEGDVINVGLGRGTALETFNNNILTFGLLR